MPRSAHSTVHRSASLARLGYKRLPWEADAHYRKTLLRWPTLAKRKAEGASVPTMHNAQCAGTRGHMRGHTDAQTCARAHEHALTNRHKRDTLFHSFGWFVAAASAVAALFGCTRAHTNLCTHACTRMHARTRALTHTPLCANTQLCCAHSRARTAVHQAALSRSRDTRQAAPTLPRRAEQRRARRRAQRRAQKEPTAQTA